MKNNSAAKKIGVWGFGRVGKSVVSHLHAKGHQLAVLDNRTLSSEEKDYLAEKKIPLFSQQELAHFLADNDAIVPSPGIDLRAHAAYNHKWLSELDLFARAWHKPYIAITGTVGKTTVTHLLGQLLQQSGLRVAVGGNIGIAMLELVAQQETVDLAVLELSSFQLQRATVFTPDLALWTNFYANHLDQHSSEQEYFDAKATIMRHQHAGQQALVPLALAPRLPAQLQGKIHFFSPTPPSEQELALLPAHAHLFFIRNQEILRCTLDNTGTQPTPPQERCIAHLTPDLLEITFAQNWLALCAMLDLQGLSCAKITTWAPSLNLPAHRLEKVATIAGVDFYNDSKATTPQSTLAAVKRLQGKPVTLFLGGLSKGIDRSAMIKQLQGQVKMVYCFGKEAAKLSTHCT
ncbi:UDP-N-acetylmuramoyl-L-alanine--D-glutamate ligase, partial [Methylicorpusculum sp.]|uniref:UDP-N-acetylmuramoyl-L-alanine--D-glutamate ligase n=1 Tax=Methylicorpusculum sp. TaxID=2713644 RepID=UPI002ABB075D